MVQRRGPSDEFAQIIIQLTLKFRILLGAEVFLLQLAQRMHQGLGHITPPVRAKPAGRIRELLACYAAVHGLQLSTRRILSQASAPLAAATKARIRFGSLRPGSLSTPLETSTPNGCTLRTALATFSGVSPPARKMGFPNS